MMKKQILLPFFMLFSILTIQAQTNYIDGYIITNSNDTIQGWIDYRTDKMNGEVCKFKSDPNAEVQTFHPGQITGFRYTEAGKFYISKTVTLKGVKTNLFLEYLLQGVMNLYYYQENDTEFGNYYFLENEKGEMTAITKEEDQIIKNEDDAWVKKEDIKYKGIINYLFRDYDALKKEAFTTKFIHKDMINLAKDYHKLVCTSGESCIEFETKVDRHIFKTDISVYAGVDYSTFFPRYFTAQTNLRPTYYSPMIGGQLAISVPRWFKSVSILVDISLTKNHLESTAENYPGSSQKIYMRTKVNGAFYTGDIQREIDYLKYTYDAIKITGSLGLKYTFGEWRVKPTIEGGLDTYSPFFKKHFYNFEVVKYNSLPAELIKSKWNSEESVSVGTHLALGLDYSINKEHAVIFNINRAFREDANDWQVKLGYTF